MLDNATSWHLQGSTRTNLSNGVHTTRRTIKSQDKHAVDTGMPFAAAKSPFPKRMAGVSCIFKGFVGARPAQLVPHLLLPVGVRVRAVRRGGR